MKQKIKDSFITLWYYITFPFNWLSTRKIDKLLTQVAAEDRAALLNEKDVEFLRSLGVNTTLEELRSESKKVEK